MTSSAAGRAAGMAIVRVLSGTFLYTSILNLTISSESQRNLDSNDILSVRKYCQLFTHESNTFLGKQYTVEDWTECVHTHT